MQFCSLYPSPRLMARDTFPWNWGNLSMVYIFPPVENLPRILHKAKRDGAPILIAPRWYVRPWFAAILNMLIVILLIVVDKGNLLSQFKILHPNPRSLNLVAWLISGNSSESMVLRKEQLT